MTKLSMKQNKKMVGMTKFVDTHDLDELEMCNWTWMDTHAIEKR